MAENCIGQIGGNNRNPASVPIGLDTLNINKVPVKNLPTTTVFDYFKLGEIGVIKSVEDTLLDNFETYEPLIKTDDFLVNLGNMGSSIKYLNTLPKTQKGYDIGYHNYDSYRLKIDSFKFYNLNRPYSNFLFSPFSGQENYIMKAEFSRNFKNDLNFSLDYQKIDQVGFYNSQATTSTYAGFGFWKKKKNRSWFLTGIVNANNEMFHGGISSDTVYQDSYYNRRDRVDVILDEATTRHASVNIAFINHIYPFRNNEDWTKDLRLNHMISYEYGSYKFFDALSTIETTTAIEQNYYQNYISDSQGIRNYSAYKNIENRIGMTFSIGPIEVEKADLVYKFLNINQEPITEKLHDLFLDGKLQINFSNQAFLRNKSYFNVGTNPGDFDFDNKIFLRLAEFVLLESGLRLFAQSPSLIQRVAYINQELIWNNEFSKTVGLNISAAITFLKLNTKIYFSNESRDNSIYYNNLGFPDQYESTINLFQIGIKNKFNLGLLGAQNELVIQSTGDNIYALPTFFSKHNVYIQGYIFKKRMHAKLGIESRLISNYESQHFHPVYGIFYNPDDLGDLPFTYPTHLYTSFKIDKFRAFFKLENLDQLWNKRPAFYIQKYPLFDFKLRIGVSWLIKD